MVATNKYFNVQESVNARLEDIHVSLNDLHSAMHYILIKLVRVIKLALTITES